MQLQQSQLQREQSQLKELNSQLQCRSQKFGADFSPLSLGEYKMLKVRKASETGRIQYLDNILLSEIEDLQLRKRTIQQRLMNFYPDVKVQSGDKYFAERQVPDFSEDTTTLRQEAWYLFGVDYMSNELIRSYFGTHPHFRIEWLNDSSCNIVFDSQEEAALAILPHRKGDQMSDDHEIWYELKEYEVDGVMRKLFCRQATNKDVKKEDTQGRKSQYYKWLRNKNKLSSHVRKVAKDQITKTKAISKDFIMKQRMEKFHVKSEMKESSSGVDDSD